MEPALLSLLGLHSSGNLRETIAGAGAPRPNVGRLRLRFLAICPWSHAEHLASAGMETKGNGARSASPAMLALSREIVGKQTLGGGAAAKCWTWSQAERLASAAKETEGNAARSAGPAVRALPREISGKQSLGGGAAANCRTNAIEMPLEPRRAPGLGSEGDGRGRSPLRQPGCACAPSGKSQGSNLWAMERRGQTPDERD